MTIPNLIDCGGVGDDITDNTANGTVAAFIAAAQAAGVGYIPPGRFRHQGFYFTQPVRIFGDGMFAAHLRLIGNPNNVFSFVLPPGPGNPGAYSVILEDLDLLPAAATQLNAVGLFNTPRYVLNRVKVYGGQNGVWSANSFAGMIDQCVLTSISGSAISYDNDWSANGASVTRNSIFGCGSGVTVPNATVFALRDNDIEGNTGGQFSIVAQHGMIEGNHCEGGGYNASGGITLGSNFLQ